MHLAPVAFISVHEWPRIPAPCPKRLNLQDHFSKTDRFGCHPGPFCQARKLFMQTVTEKEDSHFKMESLSIGTNALAGPKLPKPDSKLQQLARLPGRSQ